MTVGWGESVVGRTPSMIPVFKVYTNQFWTGLGWAQLGWVVYRGHNTQPAAASIERVCPSLPRHYHRHNVGVFTPPFGDCGQHLWMMMSSGCDWWRPGHVTPVRAGQVTWWWAAAVIGGDRVTWPRWELASNLRKFHAASPLLHSAQLSSAQRCGPARGAGCCSVIMIARHPALATLIPAHWASVKTPLLSNVAT